MPAALFRRAVTIPWFACLAGCTFHSTATHWHGRVGIDGKPVFMTTTTAYGLNLAVVLPVIGDTRLDETISEACAEIARSDSTGVRVVETESSNYWFALPPFTWIFSPVVMSVSIEYTPSAKLLAEVAAAETFGTGLFEPAPNPPVDDPGLDRAVPAPRD